MKRVMTLLLVLLLAFGLAACGTGNGGGTENGDEPDNTVTDNNGGNDTEEETGDKPVLRVAMECAYAPYNWKQPTDANGAVPIQGSNEYANGYDVMMAKIIADKLGYELQIQAYDWEGIIPAVQSGTVDVAICGQSITSERLEMVDFTEPYYYATIVTLVPEDGKYADATSVADLAGAKAISQHNTIWNDICLPQISDAELLPGAESAPAMLIALTSGRVDLVVTDQPTGLAAIAAYPTLKMLEFEGEGAFKVSEEEINIGISMKKGSELREAINGVLSEMTEADYVDMMNQAIAVQPLTTGE